MLAAAIAADNVVTNLHFLLIIFLPGIAWLTRRYPTHHMDTAEQFTAESQANLHRIADLDIAGLLASLALAFLLAAIGQAPGAGGGWPPNKAWRAFASPSSAATRASQARRRRWGAISAPPSRRPPARASI